jgi:hypothetical protein
MIAPDNTIDLRRPATGTGTTEVVVGSDGLSAYQLAVNNGFVGTLQQWLLSLKGADGTIGQDGSPGTNGLDGADGYTPVKGIDYFDGATGPKGDKGDTGLQGPQGAQGIQGIQGPQGPQGIKGDTGTAGTNGTNGTNGVGVPVGGTAGQVLSKIDGTDYNTQWTTPSVGGGGLTAQTAILTATQASTVVTMANVTALALPMEANAVYQVVCFVTFQSAATTTGLGLGYTSPSGCRCMCEIVVPLTSTAVASQLRTIFPSAAIATNTGSVLGTGVTAINSNHTAMIRGIIRNGATAGNFQVQFRSEIASSAVTLQIGSELQLIRIA